VTELFDAASGRVLSETIADVRADATLRLEGELQ
jgi:hypothetical protein